MPLYDYRCTNGHHFEARHGFDAPSPVCPECSAEAERIITRVPGMQKGMLADAGSGGKASKEQLQAKWAEETPKLREQLTRKLGEETVNKYAPSLNTKYD
jgi:putative FmdB family regulatory protein